MSKTRPFLSKSKFLDAVKCPKLVWYEYNQPKEVPKPDKVTQAIFDQGTRVGLVAQTLFPDGIKVARDWAPEKMHAKSMEAAKLRKPLFEPGFIFGQTYALADILLPVNDNEWDLIEVKSGTNVAEVHIQDVAFQKYVYSNAGLKIRSCFVMYINNQYLRQGKIEPEKLFIKQEITENIQPYLNGLDQLIESILTKILGNEPQVKIGPQCNKPYGCPLIGKCWDFLPKDNIFNLRGSKKNLFGFLDQGIMELKDLPIDGLNEKQLIQITSHRTGQPFMDAPAIKEFLEKMKYPLYFLDFETLSSSVPVYDLTHAFDQVPFQFSLHIIQKPGDEAMHYSFLAPGQHDPRPQLLEKLHKLLGDSGSIVAYNMNFEIGCLRKSAEAYPAYQPWLESIQNRFVDLLVPFKNFSYYHPLQAGSASIKAVLPALTQTSYKGMEIADGGTACLEYERVTFDPDVAEAEKMRVRHALEEYCKLDTQAMIDIYFALVKAASQ